MRPKNILLSPIEKREIADRAQAMRIDEKIVTLQHMPTQLLLDELGRRQHMLEYYLNSICASMQDVNECMTIEEMSEKVREIRAIVNG